MFRHTDVRRGVSTSRDPETVARELHAQLDQPSPALVLFYCAADFDLPRLATALEACFPGTLLVGCTTAGEITPAGYLSGCVTGVSFGQSDFRVHARRFDGLRDFSVVAGEAFADALVSKAFAGGHGDLTQAFCMLLIDGLSFQEEGFVSAVSRGLGGIPLFGGSAGDGTRFEQTWVYHDGAFRRDVAVAVLFQTARPFRVFKTQHFVAGDEKMVVTRADPPRRIVTEINGEPAGREYARLVGLADVQELSPLIFAANPVVVRVGGTHYLRSIQRVNPDQSLSFFCSLDEGIVLTVARAVDMIENLEAAFGEVRDAIGPPDVVLGCDCILRHIETDRTNTKTAIGRIMADNRVIGFSTYGEQFGAMHINQTFTGVAIGAAASEVDARAPLLDPMP